MSRDLPVAEGAAPASSSGGPTTIPSAVNHNNLLQTAASDTRWWSGYSYVAFTLKVPSVQTRLSLPFCQLPDWKYQKKNKKSSIAVANFNYNLQCNTS